LRNQERAACSDVSGRNNSITGLAATWRPGTLRPCR